jgi:hypothetical protein
MYLVYLVLTAGLFAVTGYHYLIGGMPSVVRRLALVLIALLPLGQACRQDRLTYPLQHWGMYSGGALPERIPTYFASDDLGAEFHYPFRNIAFSSPRAFMARFQQLIDACHCDSKDPVVDAFVLALADLHQGRTGRRVLHFWVDEVTVSTSTTKRGQTIRRYQWSRGDLDRRES